MEEWSILYIAGRFNGLCSVRRPNIVTILSPKAYTASIKRRLASGTPCHRWNLGHIYSMNIGNIVRPFLLQEIAQLASQVENGVQHVRALQEETATLSALQLGIVKPQLQPSQPASDEQHLPAKQPESESDNTSKGTQIEIPMIWS